MTRPHVLGGGEDNEQRWSKRGSVRECQFEGQLCVYVCLHISKLKETQ